MNNEPLITVSIPLYNSEKYIERCLNSVFKQTYSNIEILLVDDKGKDNSVNIVKTIKENNPDKNISIIHHQKNSGLSIVRNTGIDNAKGKYLFFLDSDDEITPDCISELYNTLVKENVTMVVGSNQWINTFNNTKSVGFPIQSKLNKIESNSLIFKEFCENNGWPVSAWNKLFDVSFFRTHKIYFIEGLFSQDELWSFHTALKLDKIAFNRKVTYLYYLHSESVIFNKTKINFENYQTIAQYFAQAYYSSKSKQQRSLIKLKLVRFKKIVLMMQWKAMRNNTAYWKKNYSKLKRLPSLSLFDYFSPQYSLKDKKENLFLNLPTNIGLKLFKWRYER